MIFSLLPFAILLTSTMSGLLRRLRSSSYSKQGNAKSKSSRDQDSSDEFVNAAETNTDPSMESAEAAPPSGTSYADEGEKQSVLGRALHYRKLEEASEEGAIVDIRSDDDHEKSNTELMTATRELTKEQKRLR